MRTGIILAVCLLVVVVAGGILLSQHTGRACDRCVASAREIEALTRMGAWERAAAVLQDYSAQWEKSRVLLALLSPRGFLDDITDAYEELGTEIEFENAEHCTEQCVLLIRAAEKLRLSEQITLENVL